MAEDLFTVRENASVRVLNTSTDEVFKKLLETKELLDKSRTTINGITTLPEEVKAPVEIKIRRWENKDDWLSGKPPYLETKDGKEMFLTGLVTNSGALMLWGALSGTAITAYNNTNSWLAVGSSTTAAAATQTNLQAKIGVAAMDTGFPKIGVEQLGTGSDRMMQWRSTYDTGAANGQWREFGVQNGSPLGTLLDRFLSTQGEKVTGQVWELTTTITLS